MGALEIEAAAAATGGAAQVQHAIFVVTIAFGFLAQVVLACAIITVICVVWSPLTWKEGDR